MAAIVAAIVIGCKMAEGGPFFKMLLSPSFFVGCVQLVVICWLSNWGEPERAPH